MSVNDQPALPDRYWLFAGHFYYPGCAFEDFHGSFNDLELAKEKADELERERGLDWYSIIDIYARKQVWPKEWEID